jgi:TRAP-type C4-dicarboxylate transport system permease small subunit
MLKATERVARVAAMSGGAALLLISLIISVEVVLRKVASITFGGADEISGYIFAIGTSWALSYTLLHRAHIRIDVVYNHVSATAKAWLDLLSLLSMGFVGGLIAWYGYGVLERSITLGSRANTPLATSMWIPQAIWFFGLVLFVWTLCLLFVLSLRAILNGDARKVTRMAGIPSIDEDVQAALEDAAVATGRK